MGDKHSHSFLPICPVNNVFRCAELVDSSKFGVRSTLVDLRIPAEEVVKLLQSVNERADRKISADELPPAVVNVVEKKYPGAEVTEIMEITDQTHARLMHRWAAQPGHRPALAIRSSSIQRSCAP